MPARTRIRYADYTCPAGHTFACAVATRLVDADQLEAFYQPVGIAAELPIPKCPAPECPFIGEPTADLARRSLAQVPESERFQAWLSPDGARLAVPPARGRDMPIRYKQAGYIAVEAHSMRDLDRFDRIRAAQTGNECWNEMNYGPSERAYHDEADASDDPKSVV